MLQERLAAANLTIDVFPAVGNHDLYPASSQDFTKGAYASPELNQMQ
jgi:hypothetical protein